MSQFGALYFRWWGKLWQGKVSGFFFRGQDATMDTLEGCFGDRIFVFFEILTKPAG